MSFMTTPVITALFICVMMMGCGGTAPSFYILSTEGPLPSGRGVGIGVGPVSLAEYVDREKIVVQVSPNKLEIAEDHLWAGDLDDSLTRVLTTNIGRRVGTGNVRSYPWQRDSELDYQVAMEVRKFLAGADGYAHIEASWRLYRLPEAKLVATKTFVGAEPIESEDFDAVAAALSRLLGRLAGNIAGSIRK